MIICFTGTRHGLSPTQRRALRIWLPRLQGSKFLHGDAVGADKQAAHLAGEFFDANMIFALPAGKDPLVRNRRMVKAASLLVAAPFTDQEQLRSGTWATVRYARKKGIPVLMLSRGDY